MSSRLLGFCFFDCGFWEEEADFLEEGRFISAGELVFPDSQDSPAGFAQGAGHETVARFVGCEFFDPEVAIVGGRVGVFWAVVPETSVDKDGYAFALEHEIGLAEDREGAHVSRIAH